MNLFGKLSPSSPIWLCFLSIWFLGTSLLWGQSLPKRPLIPRPEHHEPVYDGRDFSIGQRMTQSMMASVASIVTTYPIYALKFDVQAGQPINLSPKRLYSGIGGIMVRAVPTTTAFLLSNQWLGGGKDSSPLQQLAAGVGSGMFVAALSNPFELLLTQHRLTQLPQSKVQKQILNKAGWRGMTRGLKATIARDIVYSLGLFVLPGMIAKDDSMTTAMAGVIAGVASLPLDAARGAIQRLPLHQSKKIPGVVTTLKTLYAQKGTKGLMAGWHFRAVQMALSFLVLDTVSEWVQVQHAQENRASRKKAIRPKPLYQQWHILKQKQPKS